jgi:hypothetical protein
VPILDPGPLPPEIAVPLRRGREVLRRAIEGIRAAPFSPPDVDRIASLVEREWECIVGPGAPSGAPAASLEDHHRLVARALGIPEGASTLQAWRVVVYDRFFSVSRTTEMAAVPVAITCVRAFAASLGELRTGFLRRENVECLLAGIETALDGLLSGTPEGPGAPEEAVPADAPPPAPARVAAVPTGEEYWRRRWQNAHWGFFVLSRGVTAGLRRASGAIEARDGAAAAAELRRAARLLKGATAALMLASDLPASAYLDVLRPLMRDAGGERGLTGEQSLDRDQMSRVLASLLARLKAAPLESQPLREALAALRDALRFDAIEHALAARAVVGDLPSIVTEGVGRPVSAADVLLEMARHRSEMFHFVLEVGQDASALRGAGRYPSRGGPGAPPGPRPGA